MVRAGCVLPQSSKARRPTRVPASASCWPHHPVVQLAGSAASCRDRTARSSPTLMSPGLRPPLCSAIGSGARVGWACQERLPARVPCGQRWATTEHLTSSAERLPEPPETKRRTRLSRVGASDGIMVLPMQFVCKEWSIQFSGPMPYMDHLKSARHQKKIAAQKHLEMLTGDGTTVSSRLGKETAVGFPVTASPSLQIDALPFVCKLCNVAMSSMNCQDALTAHSKGKRHQRALQTEEVLRQLAATRGAVQPLPLATVAPPTPTVSQSPETPPTSPVSQPAQEQPVKQTEENGEVIDLSCRFCGIVLFENVTAKRK